MLSCARREWDSASIRTTAGDVFSTTSAYEVRTPSTTRGAGGAAGSFVCGSSFPPNRPVLHPPLKLAATINEAKTRFLLNIKCISKDYFLKF
jgi:hypothetical protein